MSDRDQERLEELYATARTLGPEDRATFLADSCATDDELKRELTSLLEHGEPAEAFFTALADGLVSPSVGHRIGHYQLVGMLGNGGMGTVYRAHDDRLDRVVALKFLPPFLSAQPEARERFLVEARAAAGLDHPNVCSIHEIGETADGRPFIAMTCYEGETLRERLNRESLPITDAIRIAIAVAHGLGAAHARGIVHRDVKPGNVMLCSDGSVRLLDFGLAMSADNVVPGPATVQGTIAYMSPEQMRGDHVDARSDLWSLGVVLYEMLAGTRPVLEGGGRAAHQLTLKRTPAPSATGRGNLPTSLRRIVTRLLQNLPEKRYSSADDLVRDLSRHASRRIAAPVAIGLAGVTALFALTLWVQRDGNGTTPLDSNPASLTIAVMPFTVRGPGLDVWREGMVDLLSIGLDGAAGIRAINSRTLLARWNQEIGDRTVPDLDFALGVARRSQARFALVGSVIAAGPRLRLSADIYEVATGRVVGPVQAEGPADSVLALVDHVGMQVLGALLETNADGVPTLDLANVTTNSFLALKAYLEGEDHYRRSEFPDAVRAWERAVRADTLFGLAYLGLADANAWSGNGTEFRESLNRAKNLARRLPGRERAMLEIRWGRESGVASVLPTVREAIRKYPDAADFWYQLGEVYFHDAVAMARLEEAEEAFRKAVALQPTMAPYREHLLELAFRFNPDSARIARELDGYARLAPHAVATRASRIVFSLGFGDSAERARARTEVVTLDSEAAANAFNLLSHPYFADLRDDMYRAIEPRVAPTDLPTVQAARFVGLGLTDGRVHAALAMLGEPRTPTDMHYAGPAYLSLRGMPVPATVLRQLITAVRRDASGSASRLAVMSAAGAAAKLGDWVGYSELLSRMRELAAQGRAAGDGERAKHWYWAVRVTEAHGLWRRGRTDEALRQFESGLASDSRWVILWHVGELSLELGQLDQAERAFRALTQHDMTPAYLQLARTLARAGRPREARDAYRVVADAWRHADPELQLQVDEANRAIGRR
ncbi:MAG: protein kinase [Gemmatimonadales bacterium]